MQRSIAPNTLLTVPALLAKRRRADKLLAFVGYVGALSVSVLLALLGVQYGFSIVLGIMLVLSALLLISRWPVAGFFVVACCALAIDADPFILSGKSINLYVFYWPPNLTGLIERPIGFLLIFIFFVLICQRFASRQRLLQGGKLLLPFLFFLLCVAMGIAHGMTSGGDFKITVVEVRPFVYLFESYLLAYNVVSHKKHIRAFFWIVILAAGVKAVLGLYIYLVEFHANLTGHNEIMAHEESFFWVALILLVFLFCLHHCYRPQLYAALLILPCVLVSLIANQRRADYLALLIGLLVAWVLVIKVKPHARRGLIIALVVFAALTAGYVAAFGHSGGTLAEPARAILSFITNQPDLRDALSNLYRLIENTDLQYTIKQSPIIGWGFGREFLQPLALPNIQVVDPYYLYIPHNTIYWVWMRLGAIGYSALWVLIGAIIVQGCMIVRRLKDPYLQLVAIYIVAITIMEVIVATGDYQLFFYRNVIYLGLLTGILMRLPSLDRKKEQPVHENSHRVRPSATSVQRGG